MYSNFGFPGGALVNNNQPFEPEEDAEPTTKAQARTQSPLEPPAHPDAQGQGLGKQGDAELRLGRRAQNSDLGSPSSPPLTPDSCIDSLVSSDVTNLQLQFRQWRPEPHAW